MNKEDLVMNEFRNVFNKMAWLNKNKMEVALEGYKSSEIHCIEYIGKHADSNVTRLAEAFYMTNGAISKIAKKLMAKGLIESYRKPDNKKEIYFRLTGLGEEVFTIHEDLHQEFRERDQEIFAQVTDAQFDSMLHFMERYSRHLDTEIEKQGIDLKPEQQ
ncbi:MarR family transcriptional regulator [Paenibacillus sp. MMS20-IR301]|uniref:MarR family winged helix-turn-helix transcriptional regulator n=1 Tax=Paenibacillus sp. MMS20-IR301 TaxID=2895946 RepID=UPI0028E979C1|nr:MarR family transcriptional regulator [Paenibacillus sp. MMS20-IR301]WNS45146.1 MarR family transcriptional regulator [Paenibacillus sp. MMS20-IR301]